MTIKIIFFYQKKLILINFRHEITSLQMVKLLGSCFNEVVTHHEPDHGHEN